MRKKIVLEDSKSYAPFIPRSGIKKSSLWNKIKKINRFNFADVFLPGYKLNKWVFRIGIAIIFIWLLIAGASLNFVLGQNVYFHCKDDRDPHAFQMNLFGSPVCENPFYDPIGRNSVCTKYGICDRETLLVGESFGSPPSFFVNYAGSFSTFMVFFMIFLNHFLFNRGFFKPIIKELKEGKL